MTVTILGMLVLGVASAAVTVLIARLMFTACGRHDLPHHGSTPIMLRPVDPYLAGLVNDLYRVGIEGRMHGEDAGHV